MNSAKLINFYNANRNSVYLTDIPLWLKKSFGYILGLFVFSFWYYCTETEYGLIKFSIGIIVIFVILAFLLRKQSAYLIRKYEGKYGLEFKNKKKWTGYDSYAIRKAGLKAILGDHVSNEALMTRLKAQLQSEISKNKKSIQIGVPVTGFITVLVAAYLGFNLRYLESNFKEDSQKAFSSGTDFLFENSMLIAAILLSLILYKPLLEIWLNLYRSRLEDLLTTIETIEIEYLATKTISIETEISNKTMD